MSTTTAASKADQATTESRRYLTFTLNGEAYALDIFHVTEILEYRHLTVVPMMPDFIRGVINLRGRAVPVIDLATRFTGGATTVARRTSIVIVRLTGRAGGGSDESGQEMGILVDAVNKVVDFEAGDIEPPPAFGAGIHASFISGMAKRDNGFIIVLDIGNVLSVEDLASLGEAVSRVGEE